MGDTRYWKAFDLIDNHILLEKLRKLATPKEIFVWVADFLMDRFQRVKLLLTVTSNGLEFLQEYRREGNWVLGFSFS